GTGLYHRLAAGDGIALAHARDVEPGLRVARETQVGGALDLQRGAQPDRDDSPAVVRTIVVAAQVAEDAHALGAVAGNQHAEVAHGAGDVADPGEDAFVGDVHAA